MFLIKKIRQDITNNSGVCIGIVLSDGKNRVSYSMARNASMMATPDGRAALKRSGQLRMSDQFDEYQGYGRALKRLLCKKDWINDFTVKNKDHIRPTVVEEMKKYIYATAEEKSKLPTPTEYTNAERLLAEMLEMQERSNRYFS